MKRLLFYILFFVFLLYSGGLYGGIDNIKSRNINEKDIVAKVVKSNFGTDIFVTVDNKETNITYSYPGKNYFPQIFEGKNRFYVSWIQFEKNRNKKLYIYDSLLNSSRVLIKNGFEFIGNPKPIYWRGRLRALFFLGLKSKSDDAFVLDIYNNVCENITETNEFERSIDLKIVDGEHFLNIETDNFIFKYWIEPKSLETKLVKKTRKQLIDYKKVDNRKSGYDFYNKIIAFGDSITWGKIRMNEFKTSPEQSWAEVEHHPELTYWGQLAGVFETQYGRVETICLGINGDTSQDGRDRMDYEFSKIDGYFCLVLFGTNDLSKNSSSMPGVADNLKWIVTNARDKYHLYPIISTVPPIQIKTTGSDDQFYKENTEYLNTLIIKMAIENDIPYVDSYRAFFEAEDGWRACLEDYKGNHPSPLGHKYIMKLIKPIILSLPPRLPENIKLNSKSNYNIVISWSDNIEFDFYNYEIEYGYYGSQLNRTFSTYDTFRTFYKNFNNTDFNSKLNFRIRAVDKSGNKSEFSKVYSFELK